mmetsp:Transcript_16697/g.28405  ORF Transcript_16697/g.28405 Transcript_16697/m.28405 type:complete len:584 (-) Transcript_16697:199-1950(-)
MPSPLIEEELDAEAGRRYSHFSEKSVHSETSKTSFRLRPFDPESHFLEVWDMIFLLLLLALAIFTPMDVAFDLSSMAPQAVLAFVWVVDIIFLIDMAFQFLTGYHERLPNSRYVKDFRKIAYRYITGWFFIDLTSSLPYQFLSTYPAARLLRLLRLHRAPSIVRQHQSSIGVSFAILSLSKFYVVLFFTCHWIACIWASIAWNSENSETSESGSWLQALESSKGGPASLYSSWLNVYTISLYWAIMTLTSIGYGDITPQNGTEYVVACCCMAVVSSMWAVVIGQMCGVLATLLPHDVAFKRTMDDLNWMMRDRGMPKHLRSKLRRYFWESRSLTRLMEQRKVIERMSPMLQGVVARQLSEQWLSKVRYLQLLDQETLVAVARKLTPQLFAPHEAIEKQRTLFVVRRGVCMHGGRVLVAGSLWGEDMLVSNDALREHYSVRCLTYLEVLSLRYPDFQIAVQSEKSRRIIRWWQIRLSLTHGVKKIADQVRQLHAREKAQFDTLRWEDRRSLLARILRGDNIQSFARKSTTCSSNSKSSEIGTEVEPAPSGVLVASEEFESMKQAIIHLTKTVEQLQQTVLERSG